MVQVNIIVYDKNSGEILRAGHCDEADVKLQIRAANEAALDGQAKVNDSLHYVVGDPPAVASRPVFRGFDKLTIFADGKDVATISGLPANAVVSVDGDRHVVSDGSFQLAALIPDIYSITIEGFPYLKANYQIRAV